MTRNFVRHVYYELRKSFLSVWMLLFLVLLLLMNGWRLCTEYFNKTSEIAPYQTVYDEFYSRWSGNITTENVSELMAIYSSLEEKQQNGELSYQYDPNAYTYSDWTDMRFFETLFLAEMRYDYLYQNKAIHIAENAQDLKNLYISNGNHFEARKNHLVAELFSGRRIEQFADTHWAEVWLNHDYSSMIVLLLCLFGLSTVFVSEKETEMYMLLRTSKKGGVQAVGAKLLAGFLFSTTVAFLFYAEDSLLLLALSAHPEALDSPVYAIRYLETTPLTMSIGRFLLWTTALKTLGVWGCSCAILLISCLCKRVLVSFVSGLGCMMILTVLQEFSRTRYGLKWFNPMELVVARDLITGTHFVNLFGYPVQIHVFATVGVVLTVACLGLGICCIHPGRVKRRLGTC